MNSLHQNQPPFVVAVISSDTAAGRAELRGVSDTARRLGWTLELIDSAVVGADYAPFMPLLERSDGIIARLHDSIVDGTLASLGVPLVGLDIRNIRLKGLSVSSAATLWARINSDARSVAEAAADELLSTGRRCFVFVPMLWRYPWTDLREKIFLDHIREAGCDARHYEPITEWDWVEERKNLARWLAKLPRPFCIAAGNDLLAKFALDACRTAGLEVPRDAAIIGADDDETLCLSATPPLSSVRIDFEGAGRKAVETLATLLGKPRPARSPIVRYGILGIARRASTMPEADGVDPRIALGLDFISLHSGDPFVGVMDVAAAMGVGRRQADRLFATTGKTIRQHIEDARMAKARAMLKSGSAPIGKVAKICGFSSNAYFSQLVRKRFGVSPSKWNG